MIDRPRVRTTSLVVPTAGDIDRILDAPFFNSLAERLTTRTASRGVTAAATKPAAKPKGPSKPATTPKPSRGEKTPAKMSAAQIDRAIKGKAFMDAFGKEQGGRWFAEGLTFAQAQAKFDAQLAAKRDAERRQQAVDLNLGGGGLARFARSIRFAKSAAAVRHIRR